MNEECTYYSIQKWHSFLSDGPWSATSDRPSWTGWNGHFFFVHKIHKSIEATTELRVKRHVTLTAVCSQNESRYQQPVISYKALFELSSTILKHYDTSRRRQISAAKRRRQLPAGVCHCHEISEVNITQSIPRKWNAKRSDLPTQWTEIVKSSIK